MTKLQNPSICVRHGDFVQDAARFRRKTLLQKSRDLVIHYALVDGLSYHQLYQHLSPTLK